MKIKSRIESKLQERLVPQFLEVLNESHQHNVPENSETHFKVTCSSAVFEDMSKVKRHQQVYQLLAEEMNGGVHALALHLYTPAEWLTIGASPASPQCMG